MMQDCSCIAVRIATNRADARPAIGGIPSRLLAMPTLAWPPARGRDNAWPRHRHTPIACPDGTWGPL